MPLRYKKNDVLVLVGTHHRFSDIYIYIYIYMYICIVNSKYVAI
jgi:hypothetical protein